jgi:hypothetical protein
MLNTYIKNRGLTQTILHDNNGNQFNETNWDADYDGNIANLSFTSNTDGNKQHFDVKLNNDDLASILNVPSVGMPIDKRLQMDFKNPTFRHDPDILKIELPEFQTPELSPIKPSYVVDEPLTIPSKMSIEDLIQPPNAKSYLSSPLPNEELIVPITIDENTLHNYTLTPRRQHRHKKTHKTYRAYKKPKSSSKSKTKSKSKPKSKATKSFTLF